MAKPRPLVSTGNVHDTGTLSFADGETSEAKVLPKNKPLRTTGNKNEGAVSSIGEEAWEWGPEPQDVKVQAAFSGRLTKKNNKKMPFGRSRQLTSNHRA